MPATKSPSELACERMSDFCVAKGQSARNLLPDLKESRLPFSVLGSNKPMGQYGHHVTQSAGAATVCCFLCRGLSGFPSWLFASAPGQMRILIDLPLVTQERGSDPEAVTRVLTRLYLHELGHVAMHLDHIFGAKDFFAGMGETASAGMEAEAWQFAGTTLGLALGDYAKRCREEGSPDLAWQYT